MRLKHTNGIKSNGRANFISAMLLFNGVSISSLARKLGVSKAAVSQVVRSRTVSKRIRSEIAKTLKTERCTLWPE